MGLVVGLIGNIGICPFPSRIDNSYISRRVNLQHWALMWWSLVAGTRGPKCTSPQTPWQRPKLRLVALRTRLILALPGPVGLGPLRQEAHVFGEVNIAAGAASRANFPLLRRPPVWHGVIPRLCGGLPTGVSSGICTTNKRGAETEERGTG